MRGACETLEAVCACVGWSSRVERDKRRPADDDAPRRTIPATVRRGRDANRRSSSQWPELVFRIRHGGPNSGDDGFLLKSKSGFFVVQHRACQKRREGQPAAAAGVLLVDSCYLLLIETREY